MSDEDILGYPTSPQCSFDMNACQCTGESCAPEAVTLSTDEHVVTAQVKVVGESASGNVVAAFKALEGKPQVLLSKMSTAGYPNLTVSFPAAAGSTDSVDKPYYVGAQVYLQGVDVSVIKNDASARDAFKKVIATAAGYSCGTYTEPTSASPACCACPVTAEPPQAAFIEWDPQTYYSGNKSTGAPTSCGGYDVGALADISCCYGPPQKSWSSILSNPKSFDPALGWGNTTNPQCPATAQGMHAHMWCADNKMSYSTDCGPDYSTQQGGRRSDGRWRRSDDSSAAAAAAAAVAEAASDSRRRRSDGRRRRTAAPWAAFNDCSNCLTKVLSDVKPGNCYAAPAQGIGGPTFIYSNACGATASVKSQPAAQDTYSTNTILGYPTYPSCSYDMNVCKCPGKLCTTADVTIFSDGSRRGNSYVSYYVQVPSKAAGVRVQQTLSLFSTAMLVEKLTALDPATFRNIEISSTVPAQVTHSTILNHHLVDSSSSGLSTWDIVGIVLGSVFGCCILVGICVALRPKNDKYDSIPTGTATQEDVVVEVEVK